MARSEHFIITDRPAPDVLIVVAKILDVVSNVPPDQVGHGNIYLTKIGEATLVLEIRDSQSGEILARAIDRSVAESPRLTRSNVVTNISEVRVEARRWASLLRKMLDDFHVL